MINSIFTIITATLYSLIEIEIEGKDGWCNNLPTPFVMRLGTKRMTLYHIYMLLFITTIFLFQIPFIFTLDSLINTSSHILLFIILEDTLWFIFNPYYTIENYRRDKIWWHSNQPWYFGIPSAIYNVVIFVLLGSYFTSNLELFFSLIVTIMYIPITIYIAPYYHKYYNKKHIEFQKNNNVD